MSQNNTDPSLNLMVKRQNENASTGLGGGRLAPIYLQLTENFRNKLSTKFSIQSELSLSSLKTFCYLASQI